MSDTWMTRFFLILLGMSFLGGPLAAQHVPRLDSYDGVVVRLLQSEGIAGPRIRAVSKAEFDPASSNDSPEGRQRNRRIEIRLVPAGKADGSDAVAGRS